MPLADPLADRFAAVHGRPPDCVWRAPGRVNLIGEHTDHNQGWVLPFAIDLGVTVAAARRGDRVLTLRSRQADGAWTIPLDALRPGAVDGWAAYPAGVAWALGGVREPGGADLLVDADLPQGAGLSSSAALECATALALAELYAPDASRAELARIARRAENDFVGVPCGIMDQTASLLAAPGHAVLLDCRTGDVEQVPLPFTGLAALVVDTRAAHALAGGDYATRRAECERAAAALGVASLREADEAGVAALADPLLRRRARHVVTENARVHEAVAALRSSPAPGPVLGPLLTASHASLRDDFAVSWPEADAVVEAALGAGAHGARMVGGGFGGSVLVLADEPDAAAVTAAVRDALAGRDPHVHRVAPAAGARRL
ncbi:galactokinase [Actinomadura parmotrematis]|uniref:Galactokinase n=1 Tax=Actinomadura parmotrematis TaxID=2864039 RepID=A0ABS7G475_9ACTN|nr:galactokinase [Actinomadura parmotrematis]MBW8487522.1 galactokinase [Actinomadura parmotrematis]